MKNNIDRLKKGFTLTEILIVTAVLAILVAAVAVVLNPGELLAQARDSQRLSDISTLKSALQLYVVQSQIINFGSCPVGGRCAGDPPSGTGPFTPPSDIPSVPESIILKSSLPASSGYHSCALSSNGKIYCFGGFNGTDGYSNAIVEYDPSTNSVATKSAILPASSGYHSCAPGSGSKIYCFGGYNSTGGYSNAIVEYDPSTNSVATKSAILPASSGYHSCALSSNGKIYCFGGFNGTDGYSNAIVEYDPSTNSVATKSAILPASSGYHSCAPGSGSKIYCFGGYNSTGGYSNAIVEYDPSTNSVATKSAILPASSGYHSCALSSNGKIYCFGGFNGTDGYSNAIVEYDPSTNSVATKSAILPASSGYHSCAPGSGSKIYCFGGFNGTDGYSDKILEYIPNASGVSGPACAATSTVRAVDGSGWMDVNFTGLPTGSPVPILPLDPRTDSAYYYAYACKGAPDNVFEIDGRLESEKYREMMKTDGGDRNTCDSTYKNNTCFYEVGSDTDLNL